MNWKYATLTAVLAWCLGGLAGKGGSTRHIMSAKTLRCATFADVVPFAAPDPKTREMAGFDVDLCHALAKQLGRHGRRSRRSRSRRACPRSSSAASTSPWPTWPTRKSRGEQIQFSDPYYLAKEMLAVKGSDPGTTKADLRRASA
jgi:polar amino acid transport system substrate-binding protein